MGPARLAFYPPITAKLMRTRLQGCMFLHGSKFMVIKAGATQFFVVQLEAQWMNQVQSCAGIGTNAYDIACIWRNLRLV